MTNPAPDQRTGHYFTAPDGYGQPTIWRATSPDDPTPTPLFTRPDLDRIDPRAWDVMVHGLVGAEPADRKAGAR